MGKKWKLVGTALSIWGFKITKVYECLECGIRIRQGDSWDCWMCRKNAIKEHHMEEARVGII